MFLTFFLVVWVALPAAYELDYRALPAAKTEPMYEFTIVMSWPGEPDVKTLVGIGTASPAEAATGFFDSLDAADGWRARRDGERVTIYGYDDVRIKNLRVEGDGPKPLVRRVIMLTPLDKKK